MRPDPMRPDPMRPDPMRPDPMRPNHCPLPSAARAASRRSGLRTRFLALLAVLLLAPLAQAAEGSSDTVGDVVIDGVLDLLAADLSDTVIVQWLATTEDEPRKPTAQDLISLRQAGASDSVIVALLSKARGELEAPGADRRAPVLPPAAPVVTRQAPAPPAAGEASVSEEASEAAPAARAGGAPATERSRDDFRLGTRPFDAPEASEAALLVPEGRGAVSTRFSISNVPYWLEDEEPWSLFVYLNGEPLTFVSEGTIFSDRPLRFNQLLKPGKQRLMIFREKHDDDEDSHLTKVMPRRIEFDLVPGGSAEVEVSFKQTVISLNDPVSYRVSQNGRLVAEAGDIGGNPDQWQWLCDDLERTLAGKDDSRLEDCVRWRELWQGYEGPTRSQVLQAFSNFEYRPVPRDQNLF